MRSASQISSAAPRPAVTGTPQAGHGEHELRRVRRRGRADTGIAAAERAPGRAGGRPGAVAAGRPPAR
jgi:hypothetical protein